MKLDSAAILADIDDAIQEGSRVRDQWLAAKEFTERGKKDTTRADLRPTVIAALSRLVHTIERYAPPRAVHVQQAAVFGRSNASIVEPAGVLPELLGVLTALRGEYARGQLRTISELVHADVFTDYLDMAAHLLEEGGFKDPAAVLAGSTLEGHLRKLCALHGVDTSSPDGKPRQASALNADLRKAGAYGSDDEKAVTDWLALRNFAAHGEYEKYDAPRIGLLIDSVREFIRRKPA